MTRERWRPIPGYEEHYEVSDFGRVKSIARRVPVRGATHKYWRYCPERILTPWGLERGYPRVTLAKAEAHQNFWVHVLVLLAFKGKRPRGMQARHLNGTSTDNRLANLVWGTPTENYADMRLHGTAARGERHGSAKLSEADVRQIRNAPKKFGAITALARKLGVCRATITKIRSGERWRDSAA